MALFAFNSKDDSILEVINNISSGSDRTTDFDYVQEDVSSFQCKDADMNLSPTSIGSSSSNMYLDNFEEDCSIRMEGQILENMNIAFVHLEHSMSQSDKIIKNEAIVSGLHNVVAMLKQDSGISNKTLSISKLDTLNVEENPTDSSNPTSVKNSVTELETGFNRSISRFKTIEYGNSFYDYEITPSCDSKQRIKLDEHSHISEENPQVSGGKVYSDIFDETFNSETLTCTFERHSDFEENNLGENIKQTVKKQHNPSNSTEETLQSCNQCDKTFKYKRHLDRHLEGHQKNNCPHCEAKFARKEHLDVHLFRSHGERVTRHPHTCELCSKGFPKRVLLNRHKASLHRDKGEVCADCGDFLESPADVQEHAERHTREQRFKCERCEQTFSVKRKYLIHIRNHDTYSCPECDAAFASKKRVTEHFRTKHSSMSHQPETQMEGKFYCTDCKQNFVKRDNFLRHLETAAHRRKMHPEVPLQGLFSCPVCSKQLTSPQSLDQHFRRVHKSDKKFSCDTQGCKFQSSCKSDLDRHRQLHLERRNIVCEHCGKTFTSVRILKDHVLYVHNKERKFVCEECGKAFKRNSLLKRHQMSHQQIRPYACSQCRAAFKRSHHLDRHMEICHKIKLEKKRKVVKLMKTENGELVPIPDAPKKPKLQKVKIKREKRFSSFQDPVVVDDDGPLVIDDSFDTSMVVFPAELSQVNALSAINVPEAADVPIALPSSLSEVDSIPQILSLIDVHSGQVVTVEVSNPDTLTLPDSVDQFGANCNEMLGLSSYQDLGFQNGILSADQSYYDQVSYAELPLENVSETPLLLDTSSSKMDTLPAIENYLTQPFPPFLNL